MKAEHGFTLLEIIAALAIAVVGIAAVVKTTSSAVDVLQSTEDRVLGTWVASNRLAELRLSRTWPAPATKDATNEQGGRTWYYREQISATADPDLLKVDLSVFSDKDQSALSAKLFGYLSRYSPPSQPAPAEQPEEEQDQESGGDIENEPGPSQDGAGDEQSREEQQSEIEEEAQG